MVVKERRSRVLTLDSSLPLPLPLPRPPLDSLENSFDFVREVLQECWAEDPEQRPDLKAVRARLRPLRKGMYV